jgi:tetratricopeptide (TPR) repeat protein
VFRSTWAPAAATAVLLAAGLCAAPPARAVTDDERIEVYREFRQSFDARRYQDALPVAQRLVALTEEQYGPDDRALVNPLANLGTTLFRMGDYTAAEEQYLRGVRILEASGSGTERLLLRPLQGLGATYFVTGHFEDARRVLRRAVDLSRNLDGLFNVEQLEVLEPLIESYVQLAEIAEAEKEHQYAFRVAESAYGRADLRMLRAHERYARWFEFVGRYTTARALHARALTIAERSAGKQSVETVEPLRGIARTYRLEFANGTEEELGPGAGFNDPFGGSGFMPTDPANAQRLNPDGERALRLALQALDNTDDHRTRGETLVELGDWHIATNSQAKAHESYREAWQQLQRAGDTELLDSPRLLAYRPPSASISRTRLNPESAEVREVEYRFTVMPDGRLSDFEQVESTAPDSIARAVLTSLRRARYSPRLVDGQPVATPGITLREKVAVRRTNPAPAAAATG